MDTIGLMMYVTNYCSEKRIPWKINYDSLVAYFYIRWAELETIEQVLNNQWRHQHTEIAKRLDISYPFPAKSSMLTLCGYNNGESISVPFSREPAQTIGIFGWQAFFPKDESFGLESPATGISRGLTADWLNLDVHIRHNSFFFRINKLNTDGGEDDGMITCWLESPYMDPNALRVMKGFIRRP